MKMTLIVFGSITFDELPDGTPIVIVHEVEETKLSPLESAEKWANDHVTGGYAGTFLIPTLYTGKIVWE